MKLLVIGGTRFSGRALSGLALAAGHELTLFHRGGDGEDPWPDAEHVHADRADGFGAIGTRSFDVVIDMCGYVPRELRASCATFADAALYAFVSSLSVHRDDARVGATEDDDLLGPPFPDTEEITDETYGALKVASELEVRAAFGERALILRPGLIVGPFDRTDRFTYWVRRIASGGEVLVPEPPGDPAQWIDARDLAAFALSRCERREGGTFSIVAQPAPMEDLVTTCRDASGADATFTWVSRSFLDELGVEQWTELPLWMPAYPGFNRFDASRAVVAGLRTRPLAETVADTLAWDRTRPQTWPMGAGLAPERERELLAAWHAR